MYKKIEVLLIKGYFMDKNVNIFYHAPKELTTDAFLTWILFYLDSTDEYKIFKQNFFDSLILRNDDKGRAVKNIDVKILVLR